MIGLKFVDDKRETRTSHGKLCNQSDRLIGIIQKIKRSFPAPDKLDGLPGNEACVYILPLKYVNHSLRPEGATIVGLFPARPLPPQLLVA